MCDLSVHFFVIVLCSLIKVLLTHIKVAWDEDGHNLQNANNFNKIRIYLIIYLLTYLLTAALNNLFHVTVK